MDKARVRRQMPLLYHGTNRLFATVMCGPIGQPGSVDVTRGGGEFGRGFYTQVSLSNALRRGYALYGVDAVVLVLDVDDQQYHRLRFKRLNLQQAQRLNSRLKGKARGTYVTRHDAIVGPLVFQPKVMQQKFQSTNAENLLNGPFTQRTLH